MIAFVIIIIFTLEEWIFITSGRGQLSSSRGKSIQTSTTLKVRMKYCKHRNFSIVKL